MSELDNNEITVGKAEGESESNVGEFQRLKREIINAQGARGKWLTEAKRAFNFVASRQWDDKDVQLLNEQNRPAITFNRCAPIIKAVCGLEVNNRQSVIYLGREEADVGPNEMITAAGKWVRDECQAEDEESLAFRDTVICGEGWTETRMDFDEDPMGKIVMERINPLEMGVNKSAGKANYKDARIIYRIREMEPDDVRALLDIDATVIDAALHAGWLDKTPELEYGGEGDKRDYPDKTPDYVPQGGRRRTVRVVQVQYWKREAVNMVAAEGDQEPQELNDEDFAKFQERATALELKFTHARTFRRRYYQAFLGQGILDLQPLEMGEFQFKAMTGERDEEGAMFYGMLRDMFDPQMWANKWLSQTMHIMNSNAKGGLIAETDAFTNIRKAQKDWADPTKIVWVKPGSLQKQKVKERNFTQLPAGLDQLMMFAISSIRDVSGVNLEMLGQADREQAASLETQRRQSAMTILAVLFDSLRRYRKNQGRLLLRFLALLPEGTLIRVLKQGHHEYIPFAKQGFDPQNYDTIIDEAPTSPDQKQFIWAVTVQILQMQILPPAAIIELLKYSPYPESVVAEIRKALGMEGEMPPEQLAEKLKQAEGALQMLEQELAQTLEKLKEAEDEGTIEMLKLELQEKSVDIDRYKAETERLREQWSDRVNQADSVVKAFDAETRAAAPSGEQTLPSEDVVGGSPSSAPQGSGELAEIKDQVGQLTNMIGQLLQAMGGPQQQMEPVPAVTAPEEGIA